MQGRSCLAACDQSCCVTKGYHDGNVRLLEPQTLQISPPKPARLECIACKFGDLSLLLECTEEKSNPRPENLKSEVLPVEQRGLAPKPSVTKGYHDGNVRLLEPQTLHLLRSMGVRLGRCSLASSATMAVLSATLDNCRLCNNGQLAVER